MSTPATSGNATDTPRTDAVLKIASIEDRYLPLLKLSRQLERELADKEEAHIRSLQAAAGDGYWDGSGDW